MNKCIEAIEQVLIDAEIDYVIDRDAEVPEVRVRRKGAANNTYRIRFIARENGEDLSVRVFCLLSGLSEEQKLQILPLLNEYNMKYGFFGIYCDKDGDVNLGYDFPKKSKAPEKCVLEIINRIAWIVDEIYPELRSVIGDAR